MTSMVVDSLRFRSRRIATEHPFELAFGFLKRTTAWLVLGLDESVAAGRADMIAIPARFA